MNTQTRTDEYQEEDVYDFCKELEKKGIEIGLKKGLKKGRQEGLKKGLKKGREEEHNTVRTSIVQTLRERFSRVSRRVTSGLKQVNDILELMNIAIAAKNSPSMQEFEKLLPAPSGR